MGSLYIEKASHLDDKKTLYHYSCNDCYTWFSTDSAPPHTHVWHCPGCPCKIKEESYVQELSDKGNRIE